VAHVFTSLPQRSWFVTCSLSILPIIQSSGLREAE
jgi:hypothetical protein